MWSFSKVKELRHQYIHYDKEITEKEKKHLQEYIDIKKQFPNKPGNNRKHEMKAENLLKQIEGDLE